MRIPSSAMSPMALCESGDQASRFFPLVRGTRRQYRRLGHSLSERYSSKTLTNLATLITPIEVLGKAKAEGKYRGGIPTARAKAKQVIALVDAGKTRAEAAEELGISIRSVFRILRTRKDAEAPVAPPVTRIRTRPQVGA